jgi:hypothetical protein
MFGQYVPYAVRVSVPPLTLALCALHAIAVAFRLLFDNPGVPLVSVVVTMLAAYGGLLLLGAWGLQQHRFWARGFGIGALSLSAMGLTLGLPFGAAFVLPGEIPALLFLLGEEPALRFERRPAFLEEEGLDAEGAKRLLSVSIGLGLVLPLLFGSVLGLRMLLGAPAMTLAAAAFGVAGFWGFTQLRGWSFAALLLGFGAFLVAALLATSLRWPATWFGLGGFALATGPLLGPVARWWSRS